MTLVLDVGALVAVERRSPEMLALIRREHLAGRPARTHGGVVGQVWRGGSGRQAVLARAIGFVSVVPLDAELGKRAGELLARSGTRDVIDAAIVLLAQPGDRVLTSDPDDVRVLAVAAGLRLEIIPV
jgi:hypothetical protein